MKAAEFGLLGLLVLGGCVGGKPDATTPASPSFDQTPAAQAVPAITPATPRPQPLAPLPPSGMPALPVILARETSAPPKWPVLPKIDLAHAATGAKVYRIQDGGAAINVNQLKSVHFGKDTLVIAYENTLNVPYKPNCTLSIYNSYGMRIAAASDRWSVETVAPGEVRTSEIDADAPNLSGTFNRFGWDDMLKYSDVTLPSDWNVPAYLITDDKPSSPAAPATKPSAVNKSVALPRVDMVQAFKDLKLFPVKAGVATIAGRHIKRWEYTKNRQVITYENTTTDPHQPNYQFRIYNSYGIQIGSLADQWSFDKIQPQERRKDDFPFFSYTIDQDLVYSAILLPTDWAAPAFVAVEGEDI